MKLSLLKLLSKVGANLAAGVNCIKTSTGECVFFDDSVTDMTDGPFVVEYHNHNRVVGMTDGPFVVEYNTHNRDGPFVVEYNTHNRDDATETFTFRESAVVCGNCSDKTSASNDGASNAQDTTENGANHISESATMEPAIVCYFGHFSSSHWSLALSEHEDANCPHDDSTMMEDAAWILRQGGVCLFNIAEKAGTTIRLSEFVAAVQTPFDEFHVEYWWLQKRQVFAFLFCFAPTFFLTFFLLPCALIWNGLLIGACILLDGLWIGACILWNGLLLVAPRILWNGLLVAPRILWHGLSVVLNRAPPMVLVVVYLPKDEKMTFEVPQTHCLGAIKRSVSEVIHCSTKQFYFVSQDRLALHGYKDALPLAALVDKHCRLCLTIGLYGLAGNGNGDGNDNDNSEGNEGNAGGDDDESLSYTKWPTKDYYAKKLPNGRAFPPRDRKNPGTGEFDICISKLDQLEQDHGSEMCPAQVVALFILKHIHLLASKSAVKGHTKHHGLPVGIGCDGADIASNWFWVTEAIHFVWHFCEWILFEEITHDYTMDLFLNGCNKPWSGGEEAQQVLFRELAVILPMLRAVGVSVPDDIEELSHHAFADEELLSVAVERARYGRRQAGGSRGPMPAATRAKISKTMKGRTITWGAKISAANKGSSRPDMIGNTYRATWTQRETVALVWGVTLHSGDWKTILGETPALRKYSWDLLRHKVVRMHKTNDPLLTTAAREAWKARSNVRKPTIQWTKKRELALIRAFLKYGTKWKAIAAQNIPMLEGIEPNQLCAKWKKLQTDPRVAQEKDRLSNKGAPFFSNLFARQMED